MLRHTACVNVFYLGCLYLPSFALVLWSFFVVFSVGQPAEIGLHFPADCSCVPSGLVNFALSACCCCCFFFFLFSLCLVVFVSFCRVLTNCCRYLEGVLCFGLPFIFSLLFSLCYFSLVLCPTLFTVVVFFFLFCILSARSF